MSSPSRSETSQTRPNYRGWMAFTSTIAIVAVVWLLVLPRLSHWEPVRQRREHLERAGVDPAAFFYDDHPASRQWEETVRKAVEQDPKEFGF